MPKANFFPKKMKPITNIIKFITYTVYEILIPVIDLTAIPIPDAPPLINPTGVTKAHNPNAKIKLPIISLLFHKRAFSYYPPIVLFK